MADDGMPIVALDGLGELRGDACPAAPEVIRFLDVPYAAPPVGDTRWRQPSQPEPFEGVRANPRVLTRCPQPSMGGGAAPVTFEGHTLEDDEDCLKLAIWAPLAALRAAEEADERAQLAAIEAAEAAAAEAEQLERAQVDGSVLPRDERPPGSSSGLPGGSSDAGNSHLDAAQTAEDAEADTSHLLPIIFYIHGGGGRFGSCHTPAHGGEALAASQNVVFISVGYRLGILGFLAHPALSSEDRGQTACCGNYAIADQFAALTWVQAHATSFGGNPNCVTIMGLSSGAQYVSTLIVSPPSRHPQWGISKESRPTGLFHRAFAQSCVDLPNVRKLQSGCEMWGEKSAEEWGEELAEGMGCPTEEDAELADSWHSGQLASLRKLSVDTILEHGWDEAATDCYESVIDPRGARWGGALSCLKPASSLEALETGAFHRVPTMIGSTEQDGLGKMDLELTVLAANDVTDREGLAALFEKVFREHADAAMAHYYPADEADEEVAVERALGLLGGDLWYQGGSWHMANVTAAAAAAPPVYLYSFTEKVFAGNGREPRSFHGSDLTFWHGSPNAAVPGHTHPDPAGTKLGATMMNFLGNFARTGNPNDSTGAEAPADLPDWPQHIPRSVELMALGEADAGPKMAELAPDVADRFALLADQYFSRHVPRQLAEGSAPPEPTDARAGAGWSGRRRMRL